MKFIFLVIFGVILATESRAMAEETCAVDFKLVLETHLGLPELNGEGYGTAKCVDENSEEKNYRINIKMAGISANYGFSTHESLSTGTIDQVTLTSGLDLAGTYSGISGGALGSKLHIVLKSRTSNLRLKVRMDYDSSLEAFILATKWILTAKEL